MRKPKRWSNKRIEVIGMVLLLFSFGWQLFEDDIKSLSHDVDTYQIHEKLDKIWSVLTDMYSQSEANKSESVSATNFRYQLESWKYWGEMLKEKSTVNFQSKLFGGIRIGLYVIGSVCLIIPKFRKDNEEKGNQNLKRTHKARAYRSK